MACPLNEACQPEAHWGASEMQEASMAAMDAMEAEVEGEDYYQAVVDLDSEAGFGKNVDFERQDVPKRLLVR